MSNNPSVCVLVSFNFKITLCGQNELTRVGVCDMQILDGERESHLTDTHTPTEEASSECGVDVLSPVSVCPGTVCGHALTCSCVTQEDVCVCVCVCVLREH